MIRDSSLSARHCEILVNGAEVIVHDLGSRNGTMVAGRLLKNQQSAVKNGQIVRFGLVDARLEIEHMEWDGQNNPESAVIDHRKIMRDQRRASKNPAPADPSAKLDSAGSAASDETEPKTILMPRPVSSEPASPSNEAADGGTQESARSRGVMLVWAAIAAVALLLVAWWIWGRR